MADPYPYTTGRMLHLEECSHFEPWSEVRLATPEELRTMPVCNDCAARGGDAKDRTVSSPRSGVVEFVCPQCGLRKASGQRTATGVCRDCAD